MRGTNAEADAAVVIYSAIHTPEIEARSKAMDVFAIIQKKEGLTALLAAIRSALDDRTSRHAEPATADLPDTGASI